MRLDRFNWHFNFKSHYRFTFLTFYDKFLKEEIRENEMKFHLTEIKNSLMTLQLKRANEEIKLYVSNKPEDKKKSFREQLLKQIADQVKIEIIC